ncbi:MAG: gliding motility lipoprotein GldH [Saprospiraceae bacterium]|nr:gliding motility lipoprotein GldH [Saprospiraceae bacterium]
MRMWIILLGTVLFAACGKPTILDQEFELPESGWTYADSLQWNFEVADTNAIYDLLLTIEHGTDFRYQNCYVRFHTLFPQGQHLTETVSLELQTQVGQWLGDCGSTDCDLTIPIQQNAFFNQPGKYAIRMEQYMRQDSLPGIESFNLRIEDTGKRRDL